MIAMMKVLISAVVASLVTSCSGLAFTNISTARGASTSGNMQFYDPAQRDQTYGTPMNVAQYLVDMHDAKATFNFCGGMMFQLVLSKKLREHLEQVAATKPDGNDQQPVIYDASKPRMAGIPNYNKDAAADDIRLFHGREIRKVPHSSGGMGFVLHLSMATADDPEGWTTQEVDGYDGWGHDVGRIWRTGDRLEDEGFKSFKQLFGPQAFALHHRFYLHFDRSNRMWLAAEDGCEGTPAAGSTPSNPLSNLFGLLG